MSDQLAYTFTTWEDSSRALMARIRHPSGSLATQANTSTITWAAYSVADDGTGTAVSGQSGTIVVASSIYDTLQTDDEWEEDDTGYNFRWTMPATAIPTGNTRYRIQVIVTPTSGASDKHAVVWEPLTKELYGQ